MNPVELQTPTNTRSKLAGVILNTLRFAGSFTDLIIHQDEEIRVKSAKGLVTLEQLNIPDAAGYKPTLEDVMQFFASYLSEASTKKSASGYWEEVVVPAFREMKAVNRSLAPNSADVQQYLRFSLMQHGGRRVGMVVRVTNAPGPLEKVGLHPAIVNRLKDNPKGLLVITGPTASGKTNTALSILRYLNDRPSGAHIVTVEDPIEFPMRSKNSIFTQREVGTDVPTFAEGLRDAMRMSPDAILAGEVRDKDTAESAILGGESGALMIVTTHGRTVAGTLRKLLMLTGDVGPAMANILSGALIGVIRQELVPTISGDGYRMVHDCLLATGPVRKCIEQGAFGQLEQLCATQTSGEDFVSMKTQLMELAKNRVIDPVTAQAVAGTST